MALEIEELGLGGSAFAREQEMLRRQAEGLKHLRQLTGLTMWEIDLRTRRICWFDVLGSLTRVGVREMSWDEVLLVYHEEERERIRRLVESASETGEQIAYTAQVVGDNGARFWMEVVGQADHAGGRPYVIIGASRDVTANRAAAEAVKRAEQRLKMALEIAQVQVLDIDFEDRTIETFAAGESFHGPGLEQRWDWEDPYWFADPRDRATVVAAWEAAMAEGRPFEAEYRVVRPDGVELWVSTAARMSLTADGRPKSMICAMRNVTEQKASELELIAARETAEAANRAKTAFLANMSHEIRTPLNGVLGMAQVIDKDELSTRQRERLGVIRQSGESLLAILDDALDVSKIEAGRLELDEHEFDLAAIVRAACKPFAAVASQKDLSLSVEIAPTIEGVWWGDGARVRQVVSNLVSNAVKFTQAGGVTVRAERAAGGVEISVADTGIGVTPEAAEHLFEKFSQADSSISRRFGGTGLGLSICRGLAGLMGGELRLASEAGKGSTFVCALPLIKRTEAADAEVPQAAPAAQTPMGGGGPLALRVLAAEDNATNQLVLRALLEPFGVELEIAPDGAEAIRAYEAGVYDIVLMDIQMPLVSGVQATREIRRIEAETGRRTPILALSANVMSHQVEEYVAAGMDGVVAKPIELPKLLAAMQEVLEPESAAAAVEASPALAR